MSDTGQLWHLSTEIAIYEKNTLEMMNYASLHWEPHWTQKCMLQKYYSVEFIANYQQGTP